MICPRCQSEISDSAATCGVCGGQLASRERRAGVILAQGEVAQLPTPAGIGHRHSLICAACQSPIVVSQYDERCPLCNTLLADWSGQSVQHQVQAEPGATAGGIDATATSLPDLSPPPARIIGHVPTYLEGHVGEMRALAPERRDVDGLQVLVAILFVVDIIALAILAGAFALTIVVLFLVLTVVVRWFGRGVPQWLGNAIRWPIAVVVSLIRPLRAAFSPQEFVSVSEGEILANGVRQGYFRVKGEMWPHAISKGEEVRIWLRTRDRVPYLARGEYRNGDRWVPMGIRNQHRGLNWLLAWLALNGAIAAIYYFVLRP